MGWFDVPKGIRAMLAADTALAALVKNRIHYQELPQGSELPHIWFTRTGRQQDNLLDASEEMTVETYSFEIVGDSDCEAIVDRLIVLLGQFGGQVGSQDVQLVDISDADDNYVFKSVGEGEPDYLHAIQIEVYSAEQTT
ncbi:MAG: DUF3168 domain-containing protein [Pirellulales bacterium]